MSNIPPIQEIERKFCVLDEIDLSRIPVSHPAASLEQGYIIAAPEVELRIRMESADKTRYYMAGKSDGTLSRSSWDPEIPEWVYLSLRDHIQGDLIKKRRFRAEYVGLTLEIDVYAGALDGLVVFECEFSSESAADVFVVPPWIGKVVEVTNDKAFKNKNLALAPHIAMAKLAGFRSGAASHANKAVDVIDDGVPGGGMPAGMRPSREKLHEMIEQAAKRKK